MSLQSSGIAFSALQNVTNLSSLFAQNLASLASGVNADLSPAATIQSEAFQAQIDGLTQATANSQDASSLVQVAQGGLSQVGTILQDIRTASVAAANTGVLSPEAVGAYQSEITGDLQAIQAITVQTQFNGTPLLDGSAGTNAAVVDTANVDGIQLAGAFGGGQIASGAVTLTVNTAATQAQATGNVTYASASSALSTADGGTSGTGGSIVLNGQSITVQGSDTVQNLIDKINAVAQTTGVNAAFTSANGSGSITLTQQNYGAASQINESESAPLLFGTNGTTTVGQNAVVTVTANTQFGGGPAIPVAVTFTGGSPTSGSNGIQVQDADGNAILLTPAGNSTSVTNQAVGVVSANGIQLQTGAFPGQTVTASLGNALPSALGTGVAPGLSLAQIDVTTPQGAANAVAITDAAISQVASQSAQLGALQAQTLQPNVLALQQQVSALSATNSQLSDTDYGLALTQLAAQSLFLKAGMAVLGQANLLSGQVLSLLK